MFFILFKKMAKNKWMIISLMLGLLLSISIVSSIPMYSDAVLRKTLKRDMDNYLAREKTYPGNYTILNILAPTNEATNDGDEMIPSIMQDNVQARPGLFDLPKDLQDKQKKRLGNYNSLDKALTKKFVPDYKIPLITETKILSVYKLLLKDSPDSSVINKYRFGKLDSIYNIKDHIKIISGRMFSNIKSPNNEYEVIVSEETMNTLKLFLDKTYYVYQPYQNIVDKNSYFKVKVVGVYGIKDNNDPFWFKKWDATSTRSLVMDFDLFSNDFLKVNKNIVLNEMFWGFAFDYNKISHRDIPYIVKTYIDQKENTLSLNYDVKPIMYIEDIFKSYLNKEAKLKMILWIYQAPILLMLLIYTFMISNMIIERDMDEISVLKSRGAGRSTILLTYFLQSIILGGISIVIGPFLGMFLCKMIGSANGFLNFVQREGLNISLKPESYLYSIVVILIFIITILVSAFRVSKNSIVITKQNKFRKQGAPFWKKGFLDLILIAVSMYGLYSFKMRQNIVSITDVSSVYLPVDPLLYIVSTLFIIGVGLLFLRLYPYIIKFIFWVGKKIWSPAVYSSLINVGRSGNRNQFVILFLLLTISIGIFNLKSAATINTNLENKIRYLTGSDIVLENRWESNVDGLSDVEKSKTNIQTIYKEPDFLVYKNIPGVQNAAKVLYLENNTIACNEKKIMKNNSTMVGIIPDEFGKTAWFKDYLLPVHWYNYLNILSKYPNAILLSRNFESQVKFMVGDKVQVYWATDRAGSMDAFVAGFIDYWPGYNPKDLKNNYLIVSNFNYLQEKKLFIPYQVWLDKENYADDETLMKDITKKVSNITSLKFADQGVRDIKNDPIIQGTNGSLSLGFIATMVITIIGFLIYWTISLKTRTLQFGILRAIGLTVRSVISMLMYEQLLISFAAIGIGTLIGEYDCKIFVPLIQMSNNPSDQVLPFKIFAQSSDYIKLFSIIAVMLLAGFIMLARYASSLKIDQAVKLGED